MSRSTPKVFLSYRREEAAGHAGRLYDTISARLGEGNVFVDVDLEPGVDFVDRIKEAVSACRVLLVIIGPRWAVVVDDDSRRRIADPDDFVRLEVETALSRPEVTVIPVLVGGAQMPDPDDLPEGLRELCHRNAIELSDARWRYDVGRLNSVVDELLAEPAPADAAPTEAMPLPQPARMPSTTRIVIDGMLIAGFAALVGRWLADPISPAGLDSDIAQVVTATLRRSVTWGLLGAALGGWLSYVHGESRRMIQRILLGLVLGVIAGALGGLVMFAPQYLPDSAPTPGELDAFSIAAFALSGGIIGVLLGILWIPRNVAVGLIAGMVSGAIVRLIWTGVEWSTRSTIQEAFQIGIQCLLIVGVVLAALQTISVRHPSSVAPAR